MDKIFIKNLMTTGIIGIHAHEKAKPQPIRISAAVYLDTKPAGLNDSIDQTINYSTLVKKIQTFIGKNSFLTLEALSEALAELILEDMIIQGVWLRAEKPKAFREAEAVGLEITRWRS
jgi:FolB domain-containing protein